MRSRRDRKLLDEGARGTFAQDQAAGEHVVDGALAGQQAHAEAIEQKIVAAEYGHVCQEPAGTEAQAGSPEIHGLAGVVSYVQSQKALSKGCVPGGAFRKRKVKPAFPREETNTEKQESRSPLGKGLVEWSSRTMIEEGIRDAHPRSQEGNKDREGDHQKKQIDDSGDEANPKTCVTQRYGAGETIPRNCH